MISMEEISFRKERLVNTTANLDKGYRVFIEIRTWDAFIDSMETFNWVVLAQPPVGYAMTGRKDF